jgi:hypothetical protein
LDSRVVNFTRAEKGESAFLAVGVNRTGRRAKSVVIIVMDVVNSLLVEINGAGLSSALLDRSCRRRRRRRPPENRTTRFIALFRACLIEYEFMGATQTSQTMKQFTLKGFALMPFCFEHADARALGTVSSSRKIYSRKT